MNSDAKEFIENEKQFHLGFLPTEQSNPKSASLENDCRTSTVKGIHTLQKIDRDVLKMAGRVLKSEQFKKLEDTMSDTIAGGGRIVFSGCGATGRLSILLESMWRRACAENTAAARYADSVSSIMTGGDYALVRSVEFFEDYQTFGARQTDEQNVGGKDCLVAITEGGETSSVIGSLKRALERGAKGFILFNNPAELLTEHLERSRSVIRDPRVTVLDLFCGPMALAGSTRMQATTSEQLIAGAALENVFSRIAGEPQRDHSADFGLLLSQLEQSAEAIAAYADFESGVYAKNGKITYFAGKYLLDAFTDTTERSPTFMLPPFVKKSDQKSPRPWTFVKDPRFSTPCTWLNMLGREPRCLAWTKDDYRAMGAPDSIFSNPPDVSEKALFEIEVGNEPCPERFAAAADRAVEIVCGSESVRAFKGVNTVRLALGSKDGNLAMPLIAPEKSPLDLMEHLGLKLVLNTVSTASMVLLGRVTGNWMSWVDLSNKKLIDRGTRLVAELGKTDYETACNALFEAKAEHNPSERVPVVIEALKKLRTR